MSGGFKVHWGVALIVAGTIVLFTAAELFRRIGEEGVRAGAEASATAFSFGILLFALVLIGIGIYLTARRRGQSSRT
jgi:cytochrome b561